MILPCYGNAKAIEMFSELEKSDHVGSVERKWNVYVKEHYFVELILEFLRISFEWFRCDNCRNLKK